MKVETKMFSLWLKEDEAEKYGLLHDERYENEEAWVYFKFFDGVAVECDKDGNIPKDPLILTYPIVHYVHMFKEMEMCIARWNQVAANDIQPWHVARYLSRLVRQSDIIKGDSEPDYSHVPKMF